MPLCQERNISVIVRVPFDEGTLSQQTRWPKADRRNTYLVPENFVMGVDHTEALRPLVPKGRTMSELAPCLDPG